MKKQKGTHKRYCTEVVQKKNLGWTDAESMSMGRLTESLGQGRTDTKSRSKVRPTQSLDHNLKPIRMSGRWIQQRFPKVGDER